MSLLLGLLDVVAIGAAVSIAVGVGAVLTRYVWEQLGNASPY